MEMGEKRDFRDKEVFTTYDAARICNANIASIKNWIAKGLLRAFRTPGGHYRIKRRDLELFVQKYNMPYPFTEKPRKRVYVLDTDERTVETVRAAVGPHSFLAFSDALEAALCIGIERPDVFIFDFNSTAFDGLRVLELVQSFPDTRNIQLVLVTSGLSDADTIELRKSWNIEDIVDKGAGAEGIRTALAHLL